MPLRPWILPSRDPLSAGNKAGLPDLIGFLLAPDDVSIAVPSKSMFRSGIHENRSGLSALRGMYAPGGGHRTAAGDDSSNTRVGGLACAPPRSTSAAVSECRRDAHPSTS